MNWPGLGNPAKRKGTIRYLIITAVIAISVGTASIFIQQWLNMDNPLRVCINDIESDYKISATLELYVDKQKIEIPANIGNNENCRHSLYTLTNDGVIHAEWKHEYPFEIGHFLWTWTTYHENGFPMRDMDESRSKVFVDGKETGSLIREPLVDGAHYRAEFFTKNYDEASEHDFLPPQ
ncbi:hypothetical protein [Candidatus Nitrosotenuis cloacae]|jgi:hypothetical protein|uniref:Uncharacterized protein n=1 Tax=Candidatus Nitrosotenuis cloacae TaxID=1603555 RepID=A0A3G1B3B2_9ARCH|nr:hypothetical protein [Candidatus Nitrosotenuis cloacae]AJZ76356.1 hypothetical protein SU86_008305 [Candidatus Nitrosotenuis cloacae]